MITTEAPQEFVQIYNPEGNHYILINKTLGLIIGTSPILWNNVALAQITKQESTNDE